MDVKKLRRYLVMEKIKRRLDVCRNSSIKTDLCQFIIVLQNIVIINILCCTCTITEDRHLNKQHSICLTAYNAIPNTEAPMKEQCIGYISLFSHNDLHNEWPSQSFKNSLKVKVRKK